MALINGIMFGGYFLSSGPIGLMYKKYFTLDSNSSVLSLGLCHIGHTNSVNFAVNSALLWTVGHYHVKKYGCVQFMKILGLSCAFASILGAIHAKKN
jgi:hypothetical protein